jgi:hypothetical protein
MPNLHCKNCGKWFDHGPHVCKTDWKGDPVVQTEPEDTELRQAQRLIIENRNEDGTYDMQGIANDIAELSSNRTKPTAIKQVASVPEARAVLMYPNDTTVTIEGDLDVVKQIVSRMDGQIIKFKNWEKT